MNPGNFSPEMMQQAQQIMAQNPRIAQLMQQPHVMAKLQQIMANPASAAQYMNDPEIMEIMQAFQGGMGGMGGMGGGGMPNPWQQNPYGAPAGRPSAGGGGHTPGQLIHIRSSPEFEQVLHQAGDKLVACDFYADWCGPCKMIAPHFERLAGMYKEKAVFVKINVDQNQLLAQNKGVQAMPTFQFYKNGRKVDEFKGADLGQLEAALSRLTYVPPQQEKPSPYRHFPVRKDNIPVYTKAKFAPMAKKLAEFHTTLTEESSPNALSAEEMETISSVITSLQDKASYHSTTFPPETFATINKLLMYPPKMLGPVLDFFRVFILHPSASQYYAQPEANEMFVRTLLGMLRIGGLDENGQLILNDTHCTLVCKIFVNMFSRTALVKTLKTRVRMIIDGLHICMNCEKKSARGAYVTALICIAYTLRQKTDTPQMEDLMATVFVVHELLSVEYDTSVLYRCLMCLGTLLFRSEELIRYSRSLGIDDVLVDAAVQRSEGNMDIGQAVTEMSRMFETPKA